MEIKKIVDYINRSYIASDYLREPDVYYYMDAVIDDINERLQAKFPTFTDWNEFCAGWNALVVGPAGNVPQPPKPEDDTLKKPGPDFKPVKYPPEHFEFDMYHRYPWMHREHPCFPRGPRYLRDNTKYDAFPDEYLRTVVALGVAVKFYTRDEEGEQIAIDYQNRYERALFNMQRDYLIRVEPWFQDNTGGYIDFSHNREEWPPDLVPRGVVMHGYNGRDL